MVTNIIQIGNSKGIILPSEILKQLRLSLKSAVSISLDGNNIVIKAQPRQGWAEAAKRAHENGMMSCLSLMCLRMKSLRIGHGRTVWSVLGRVRPYRGGEMAKTRPCVVVTPSDLNMYLTTVVIVPITSTIRNYPYRVLCSVAGREGEIATDQIRTVDKSRLKRKIGDLNFSEIKRLREVFQQNVL